MATLSSSLCYSSSISNSNQSTSPNLFTINQSSEICSGGFSDGHCNSAQSLHVDRSLSRHCEIECLVLKVNRKCFPAQSSLRNSKDGFVQRPYSRSKLSISTVRGNLSISSDGAHQSNPAGRPGSTFEIGPEDLSATTQEKPDSVLSSEEHLRTDTGGDGGSDGWEGNGKFGSGGDGDDNSDQGDFEEKEFGPLLSADEVNKEVTARGLTLPSDMAEAARTIGIRSIVLARFMDLQGATWPLGAAIRASSVLRNRLLADQGFLFKLFTEIAIDSGCATFAEVQKRGDDFWNEFELYMADLIVGVVVDAALVGMLAPFVQFRKTAPAIGVVARLSHTIQALPSSVFEAATPGRRFSIQQRIGSYFYKGIQYGAVGFTCGIIGQGIANSIMHLKRKLKKSEEKDIPVPPLVKSAALWGVFLAVSSNTRYQVVNGLERLVERSPAAKSLPVVAMAFTVGIRFANNTYGGMQFVDWARWSGVQ